MNRIFHLIIVSAVAALCLGCDKANYDGFEAEPFREYNTRFLILRNYSSDDTVWYIPDKDYSEKLPAVLSEWQKIAVYTIKAHSSLDLTFDSTDNYVTPVETYGPNDKMVIYVFKQSIWEANEWSALVGGQMWSGKCELTVEQARKLNGFVTYPMK